MKNILPWFACLSLFALSAAADTAPVLSLPQTSYTRTPDGNPVEFTVSATGTPVPDLSLSAPAGLSEDVDYEFYPVDGWFSFYPDKIGTFAFTFTATNSAGTDSKTVTIAVRDPNAPVLSVPATAYATYVDGPVIAFDVTATGTPAPSLALSSADAAPGSYTFATNTGHFAFSPNTAGTNAFVFTAANDAGTASKTVTIVVSPRSAPVISVPKESYTIVQSDDCFELSVTAQGAPPPVLALSSSTANPEDYEFFPGSGRVEFWPVELGTFTFTFTATNSEGTASKTIPVFVVGAQETIVYPSWSQIPDQSLVLGETLTFQPSDYANGNPVPFVKLTTSTAAAADYSFDNETLVFQPSSAGSFSFTFAAVGPSAVGFPSEPLQILHVEVSSPVTVPTLAVTNVTDSSATASWTACDGVSSYTLQLATDDQFTAGSSQNTILFDTLDTLATIPDGWTCSIANPGGGDYLPLLDADDFVVSEAVDASDCADLTLSLWIRTDGGITNTSSRLLVQYSVDNGSSWTGIGTDVFTSSSSFSLKTVDVSSAAGQSSVRFRFSVPGATSSKGLDISRIALNGTQILSVGSLVASTNVSALSQTFSGLSPSTVYYARVKGDDDWSAVVPFTTLAASATVPVLSVTSVTDTSATASWTACDGVSAYTLQLATDNQFTPDTTQEILFFDNPGNPAESPSEWTYELADPSGNVLQLLASTDYVVSEAVDTSACAALELSLRAQTLNGSANNSNRLLVQFSADDCAHWTDIGFVTGSSGVTAKTLDVSAAAGQSSIRFRFSAPYAASGKGVGISRIVLNGTQILSSGSLTVSTTVSGLSHSFDNLSPSTAFYARVKGDADWSSVVPFTPSASSPTEETLEIVFHDQTAAATAFTLQGTIPGHSYQLFWTTNLLSGFTAHPIGQATNATMIVPFPSTNAWFAYPRPSSVSP